MIAADWRERMLVALESIAYSLSLIATSASQPEPDDGEFQQTHPPADMLRTLDG